MHVLVTGGTGFIATHIISTLLEQGHSVVTTVRSNTKADNVRKVFPNTPSSLLTFSLVPDMSKDCAFDEAVMSDPPLDAVIHTASPFHYKEGGTVDDFLQPAINGTTGILKAIKKNAPSVKRVVVTSSFAALFNMHMGDSWPDHTYTEADWNDCTREMAAENLIFRYRVSKKLAEKAAWDFIETEKPNFSLTTMCPPLVIGPVRQTVSSLEDLNTSNHRVRDIITGKAKDRLPETGTFIWIDVRDLALAHVRAIETPEAAGKRFLVTAGYLCNREILEIIRRNFPELADRLPSKNVPGGDYPEGLYKFDNSRTCEILGIKFRSLEECVVDVVKSLQALNA